tara:strand:- start:126 stop:326 length:201 start_codon:yes stop_codon:yes gene_type:complete
MDCVHCEFPNPEQWFYCRKCGRKASESKFTTNLFMISKLGKRTDIELTQTTVDEDIKHMNRRNNHA